MSHRQIRDTDEAWDSGALGTDPAFAAVYKGDIQSQIDETMAMQPISIRLPKPLIEAFKLLGRVHGLGYQPLMRRALTRFAEAEMKLVVRDHIANQLSPQALESEEKEGSRKPATG